MCRQWRLQFGGVLLAALVTLGAPAPAQVGYDRPGGDYASVNLRSGDPAACAARCERDQRCRAWAFSYPATETALAVCWLKSRVTPRIAVSCCVSGVRGAGVIEPKGGPIEFAIDRPGGDYRRFDIAPDPTGMVCHVTCEAEEGCRAWTYQRPGYGPTPAAACYLKNRITRPEHKACCISGVVR
jgi:hypothetical protein